MTVTDASDNYVAKQDDISSLNGIVKALYESVSFLPGKQPDYSRLRSLFHPRAIIVPPRSEHGADITVHDVESFIAQSRIVVISSGMERQGFHEKEIARRSDTFGDVTSLFSTYESRYRERDAEPIDRGINSIELVRDARRWWVIAIAWDIEKKANRIPPEYSA